jgi:hypothetical protein
LENIDLGFLNLKFALKRTKSGKKYVVQSINNIKNFEIDFKNSSSGTQNSVPISIIAKYFSNKFSFDEAFKRSIGKYLLETDSLTDFKGVMNLSDIEKKIFIHIEEPELSLYPDAQCQLMNDLINKCFISNDNTIELFLSTHSPYIINQLNLLIKAYDKNIISTTDGAKFNYDSLAVYQVEDGKLVNLMAQNERLVNTNRLSDTMNDIYDRYNTLN